MRKTPVICLLVALWLTIMPHHSFAAFPLKTKDAEVTATTKTPATKKKFSERKIPSIIRTITHAPSLDEGYGGYGHSNKPGWPGIVSLVLGIIGWVHPVLWLLFGIPAIILGIVGLNSQKYSFTGGALAGLILGCLQLIAFLILIAILATLVIAL